MLYLQTCNMSITIKANQAMLVQNSILISKMVRYDKSVDITCPDNISVGDMAVAIDFIGGSYSLVNIKSIPVTAVLDIGLYLQSGKLIALTIKKLVAHDNIAYLLVHAANSIGTDHPITRRLFSQVERRYDIDFASVTQLIWSPTCFVAIHLRKYIRRHVRRGPVSRAVEDRNHL
jgi:hypothetical protein